MKEPRPVDLIKVPTGSVALDRLIEEVKRTEEVKALDDAGLLINPNAYNRVYSRHNRS